MMNTSALALALFTGYSRGEARYTTFKAPASIRQIVEAFCIAVRSKRVAPETFKAYADGWRQAEAMSC